MTRTAREVAEYLRAQLDGDGGAPISGVASPERATPGDLVYIEGSRHREAAERSAAHCVITLPDLPIRGKTRLCVKEPKLAFARAAAWLLSPPDVARSIHATAVVAPTARLGTGVSLGPFVVVEEEVKIGDACQIGANCFIGQGASLGEGCRLYPHVTLYPGARLGRRVIVHAGTVIGGDGFGYVFGDGRQWKFPQIGGVEIGDDVEIGCNTTIARGSLGVTRIEIGAKIDNLVQVGHNVRIGEHSVIAAQTGISGSSTLGARVTIAGQVGIADHCTVEDEAVVGAQAGIPTGKTIRRGQTVWGTPARPLDRFKRQYAWFARLSELAERLEKLERKLGVRD